MESSTVVVRMLPRSGEGKTGSTKDTLMYTAPDDTPVVNEEIWRAWVQEGKLREQATARKLKVVAGTVLILLAIGGAFYFLAVR